MSRDEINNFSPDRLRAARQGKGLTLDGLGAAIGVARPTLIAYEKGRMIPSPGRLAALAEALEVDPLELTTVEVDDEVTLVDLRVRAGLSGPAAAERLGITASYLHKIEAGIRPLRPELTGRLAGLLRRPRAEITAAWERGLTGRRRS